MLFIRLFVVSVGVVWCRLWVWCVGVCRGVVCGVVLIQNDIAFWDALRGHKGVFMVLWYCG